MIAAVFAAYASAAHGQDVAGTARIIDGDTLDVADVRIRLHGIDAPEKDQTCVAGGAVWDCGVAAWGAIIQLTAGIRVDCAQQDVDQYGRVVARCIADGVDVGARLVATGWALAYQEYSLDYVPQEDAARAAGLGMWRGQFVPPWDWRRGDRLAASLPVDGCPIKGNVASDGERIYHVPGGQSYGATVITTARGERWFCTEEEALAAGWRRSLK
jgi:endonuclease YncB( thermonuclease family)